MVLTMVSSGGGSGITGKKEHNIFQMTKVWTVVLKYRTTPVHYSKISATASYHRPRVTAQLPTLLFLVYHIQTA
jgi:hypothetical protein